MSNVTTLVGDEWFAKRPSGIQCGLHQTAGFDQNSYNMSDIGTEPSNANYSRQSFSEHPIRIPTSGINNEDDYWAFANSVQLEFDFSDVSTGVDVDSVFLFSNFNSTVGGGTDDWIIASISSDSNAVDTGQVEKIQFRIDEMQWQYDVFDTTGTGIRMEQNDAGDEYLIKNGFPSSIEVGLSEVTSSPFNPSSLNEPTNTNYARVTISTSIVQFSNGWGMENDNEFRFDFTDVASGDAEAQDVRAEFGVLNFDSVEAGGVGDWVVGGSHAGSKWNTGEIDELVVPPGGFSWKTL